MRLWIGKEMEGKYIGKQTLFAETPYLYDNNIDKIISFIQAYKEEVGSYDNPVIIEGLYLGAGRVDVKQVSLEKFVELLKVCWENGIVITIECTNLNTWASDDELLLLLKEHNIQVVIRHETEMEIPLQLLPNFIFKVDDHKFAYFSPFKCESLTNLETVEDNMYEGTDVLIYDKED